MKLNQIETKILQSYKTSFKHFPEWAYELNPTIPVIGNSLINMEKRIISYASAENIDSAYFQKLKKDLSPEKQFVRGRYYQDDEKFFKTVHINPFNVGDQFIVTWFVLHELGQHYFSSHPHEFAEEIAVANVSKFTIKRDDGVANIDPGSWEHFKESVPYLINDFKMISPDIVIIPETRFRLIQNKYGWANIKKEASVDKKIQFIKIYQVVPQNTNTRTCSEVEIDITPIEEWLNNSQNNLENHLRLLKKEFNKRIEEI